MSINDLAKTLGDACYVFLALNFLWGLYNVIMGFRRVKELSFRGHDEQAEFVDEMIEPLRGRHYDAVEELCDDDPARCRSSSTWRSPIASWATTSCGKSSRKSCSAT